MNLLLEDTCRDIAGKTISVSALGAEAENCTDWTMENGGMLVTVTSGQPRPGDFTASETLAATAMI